MPEGTSHALMRKRAVLAAAGGKRHCILCGDLIDMTIRPPHPDSFELHHREPKARGGTDETVVPAHRRCNRAQGARVPPPDLASDRW